MTKSAAGYDVSRETLEDFDRLEKLVRKWTPKINLISNASLPDLYTRHILDSAQLWPLTNAPSHIVDIGSGGGFPALVLAICAKRDAPETMVTMIESDRRKCVFLQTVSRELGLNAKILPSRIEGTAPQNAPLITARALASCTKLFNYALPHLAMGGRLLLLKGEKAGEEINEARRDWRFSLTTHPSKTSPTAVILEVGDLARV